MGKDISKFSGNIFKKNRDNFGDNFSFTKKDAHPIITVQASEEYFIDFALRYIDRIRILDTDAGNKIKKQIAKKVNFL